jgi:hypothetical protein
MCPSAPAAPAVGEAALHVPVLALLVVLELSLDHIDHDLVADQTAGIHNLLGFSAERRLRRDLRAEHVSCGLWSLSIDTHVVAEAREWTLRPVGRTRWQAQNLSLMRGACVPLPVPVSAVPTCTQSYALTSTRRTHEDHPDALLRRRRAPAMAR